METKNIVIGIAAIAVLGAGAVAAVNLSQDKSNSTTMSSGNTSPTGTGTTTTNPTSGGNTVIAYKDGVYEATGNYRSPAGTEEIDVKVTLENGGIKDVSVTPKADSPTSKQYQTLFVNNYKGNVVGKKIDDVTLSKVSGSSLTPIGFNEAITKIKQQAM